MGKGNDWCFGQAVVTRGKENGWSAGAFGGLRSKAMGMEIGSGVDIGFGGGGRVGLTFLDSEGLPA